MAIIVCLLRMIGRLMSSDQPVKKKGRTPDYKLKRLDKQTNERMKIGATWINQDTSITVVLDPGVTITGGPNVVFTLFPFD